VLRAGQSRISSHELSIGAVCASPTPVRSTNTNPDDSVVPDPTSTFGVPCGAELSGTASTSNWSIRNGSEFASITRDTSPWLHWTNQAPEATTLRA
jgi:hypothetical protein